MNAAPITIATTMLVLAIAAGIAHADATDGPDAPIASFTAPARPVARPIPQTPGQVAYCTVLPSGALSCGTPVALSSAPRTSTK